MELSQSLFMLHYFSSFYSLTLYIAVRNEQMGCRTWAFWIIPTLQLFVWRTSAKLCALKQKGERKRWRSCCWGKGIPFVRLFRPIPPAGWNPWLAFTLFRFQARAEVAVFGSRKTTNAILKCLLLRHFYIWRWMCHTVFLKSWDICKKKIIIQPHKNSRTTTKKDILKRIRILWLNDKCVSTLWGRTKDSVQSELCNNLNCLEFT